MKIFLLLCLVGSIWIAGPSEARADVFDFGGTLVEVEYWGGAGSTAQSIAMLVVDFGSTSFAFGYGWDAGTPTTRTMLQAIDGAGGLNVTFTPPGGPNYNVDLMTYGAYSAGGDYFVGGLWQQWLSNDGLAWAGPSGDFTNQRLLSNGNWDGFALATYLGSDTPTAPIVPEPGTLALLGVGLAVMAARAGRRSLGKPRVDPV